MAGAWTPRRFVPVDAPWRVRIRNADVLGADILVCGGQVLTCAHVINPDTGATPPSTRVVVEFVGVRGIPAACAVVSAHCWVPADDGVWGDVTLARADRDRALGATATTSPPASWIHRSCLHVRCSSSCDSARCAKPMSLDTGYRQRMKHTGKGRLT